MTSKDAYYNLPIFVNSVEECSSFYSNQHIDFICERCGNQSRTTYKLVKKIGKLYCKKCKQELSRINYIRSIKNGTYEPKTPKCYITSLDEIDLDSFSKNDRISFNCSICGALSSNFVSRLIEKQKLMCPICSKKDTNLNKFGVEHTFTLPEVRKARIDAEKKNGVEIQRKREESCLKTTGARNPMQSEIGKTNCLNSNRDNHEGVLWQQTEEGRQFVSEFHKFHPEIAIAAAEKNKENNNGVHSLALPENRAKLRKIQIENREEIDFKRRSTNMKQSGKPEVNTYGSEEFAKNMLIKYGDKLPFAFGSDRYETVMLEKYGPEWKSLFGFGSSNYENLMLDKYGPNWKTLFGFGSKNYETKILERYGPDDKIAIGIDGKIYSLKENPKEYMLCLFDLFGVNIEDKNNVTFSEFSTLMRTLRPDIFNPGKYLYDGVRFDSKWEVIIYIYYKANGIPIKREPVAYKYRYKDGFKTCYPDFEINGEIVEVKGDHFMKDADTMYCPFHKSDDTEETYKERCDIYSSKYNCLKDNGVKFIYNDDMQMYTQWFNSNYPKNFINYFRMVGQFTPYMFAYNSYQFTPFSNKYIVSHGIEYSEFQPNGITPYDMYDNLDTWVK